MQSNVSQAFVISAMSAIASNVVQLLWVFYRAYTETAHAQYEALHETQTEVQQLQLVLTQLSYLIGESEATYGVSNWTTDLREIERCLKDNKKVLEKFVLNLQRRSPWRTVTAPFTWPVKNSKRMKMIRRVNNANAKLTTTLGAPPVFVRLSEDADQKTLTMPQ